MKDFDEIIWLIIILMLSTIGNIFYRIRNELNIKKLVQDIFDFEKKENEDIF